MGAKSHQPAPFPPPVILLGAAAADHMTAMDACAIEAATRAVDSPSVIDSPTLANTHNRVRQDGHSEVGTVTVTVSVTVAVTVTATATVIDTATITVIGTATATGTLAVTGTVTITVIGTVTITVNGIVTVTGI